MKRKKVSKAPEKPQKPQKDWGLIVLLLIPAALFAAPFMCGNMDFFALALPLYIALLGAYLYFGNRLIKDNARFVPYLIPSFLALLVYSIAVLLFYSPNRYASAVSVIVLISLAGIACITAEAAKKPNFVLYSALGIFGGAALVSVRAAAMALVNDGGRLFSEGIPRIFGTFVNPNFFAGYLALAVPIGIALVFIFKHRQLRILLTVCLFFVISALLLTGSKFGIIALFLGLVFMAAMCGRKLRIKECAVILLLFVISFGIFGRGLIGRVSEASGGGTETHSAEFRIYTWKSALNMALDNCFLGVGPGRFEEAYPQYAAAGLTTHAHNSYLQFADEYGIPCGVLTGCWLLFALICGCMAMKHTEHLPSVTLNECRSDAAPVLFAGLEAGLFALLCHAMADSDLHIGASCLACAVIAGILLSAAPRLEIPGNYAKIVLERGVLLCLLMVFIFGLSDYFVHVHKYENALRLVPINAKAWLGYADEAESLGMVKTRLKNAGRDAPKDYQIYLKLGALEQLEKSDNCVICYKTALKLHPHSVTAMKRLAEWGVSTGNNDMADSYYQKMLEVENTPYEQIKGVPEMVNTAYCDAHRYFAAKCIVEGDIKAAVKHLQASCDRYKMQLDNRDYIIVSLVNGMLTLGELEDTEDKYIGDMLLMGDLANVSYASEEADIRREFEAVCKEYAKLMRQ